MNTTQKKRSQAELVAFYLGWDIGDVRDAIYQPGRTGKTQVFTVGDDYVCCPPDGMVPPDGWNWEQVFVSYGRPVYRAEPERAETEKRDELEPAFTDPVEALKFLSHRFKHAGVVKGVGLTYARDIDAILKKGVSEEMVNRAMMLPSFENLEMKTVLRRLNYIFFGTEF